MKIFTKIPVWVISLAASIGFGVEAWEEAAITQIQTIASASA